ncbi:oxidase [Roseovarius arcticus]|uniref:oxidase n=1 Tax=Roseovarius arcticus TaxID=2547404 RepID=UPI00110FFAE0|nr:oxidase [Roseovarius arcticus]
MSRKPTFLRGIARADHIRACLLWGCLPALIFYAGALSLMKLAGFTTTEVLRDVMQQTDQSSLLGFLSSIGTWLWVAAATLCFFRYALQPRGGDDRYRRLLVLMGAFSLFLGIDDFFLIHDNYLAEGILLPLYAIFAITLLVRYRRIIGQIDGTAFMIAGGLLAMSIVVDAVQESLPMPYEYTQIAEEGFKFVGAAAWVYLCFRLAAYRLRPGVTDAL